MPRIEAAEISLKKQEVEADGSACGRCGDAVYLRAFRILLFLGSSCMSAVKWRTGKIVLICQACADTIEIEQVPSDPKNRNPLP